MNPNSSDLGIHLRQTRERAGYTQHEIADVLGVVREVVSYWENDRRVPSSVQLARLAEAYGVTTGHLLGTEAAPNGVEDHEVVYQGLRGQPPGTRAGVRRWLAFLDEWADLLAMYGEALPGRAAAPVKEWRSPRAITDTRLAPRLAVSVRAHYRLGSDAIPDLRAFLDREEVLVYRVALDPIGEGEGISGVFYNHPRLGFCILVNTATTPGRQTFTLAHEFAHALFHYQERGLVSRAGDPDRLERFADEFAVHFLVPSEPLAALVGRGSSGGVVSPFGVIDLCRYFRVSYATMLIRLRGEGLLSIDHYEEFRRCSPSALATTLGLASDDDSPTPRASGITLGSYPPSVVERTRAMIVRDALTPAGAASLLHVALEEILQELLAPPEPASDEEAREFAELPAPAAPRGKLDAVA